MEMTKALFCSLQCPCLEFDIDSDYNNITFVCDNPTVV